MVRGWAAIPRRFVGFFVAVAQRFYRDQGLLRASALAYASLLAMVPLLAVMFAVLKGLGVEQRLEGVLLSRLALSSDVVTTIIELVDRVNVGTLGALGAATLLITVVSVLGTIESTLNYVWRVSRSRTYWRQVTDYLSVVLLTPFLMLAAVALTSSIHGGFLLRWLLETRYVSDATVTALKLAPVAINIIA